MIDFDSAYEMFDDGCDADSVAAELGIDIDDALVIFNDWQCRHEDNREPVEPEPIDYNMPDDWAFRQGP